MIWLLAPRNNQKVKNAGQPVKRKDILQCVVQGHKTNKQTNTDARG